GGAIAGRLAEEGAIVGIFDKNGYSAEAAAEKLGQGSIAVACDITDHAWVVKAVAEFEAKAGPTHALVNNAGWDKFAFFLDTKPELWDQLIAINLKGPINMHHAVLKGMAQRRAGRVVNIASDAGRVGSSMEAVYSACKGGIISFTKTMAREMARSGVTLNAVCPGPTDTPLLADFMGEGEKGKKIHDALVSAIPMKRLGRPEDLAGIVTFLASDEAAYITGQVISASGGLTMVG
ncbi:MAG TPA: SDR family oxidoreductase, partial [Hyphomicrobiaceae bacterium]|nr:SDR family oxidoreductase [Hyphomicrobiaceae bacterium]